MNLFFLIAGAQGPVERFLADVTPLVPEDKLEVYRGLAGLEERLRRPRDACCAAIVFGPSHEDLEKIVGLRGFFQDAKILLVLGDQSPETIALAHKLKPTYISEFDDGTSGVVSVLKHLVRAASAREGRT